LVNDSRDIDVGSREVIPDEQQRQSRYGSCRVAHAVTEVQLGRVTALSVSDEGLDGGPSLLIVECDHAHSEYLKEFPDELATYITQPAGHHDFGLEQDRSGHHDHHRAIQFLDQLLMASLFPEDRDRRGAIDG
jgi:hypothetical protein